MSYSFSLYEASFTLLKAGSYSGIIQLTQYGGLIAKYYKTVDFQSLIDLISYYSNDATQFYT